VSKINAIFGPGKVSPAMGNRILAVLHGRRLQGTLDLDLPLDIARAIHSHTVDVALNWLRQNHPVDEEAAMRARVEREEREKDEEFLRHAEEAGLYKPQSGAHGAELGEGNDIYGKSVLKKIRQENEARLLAEDEKKRKEWLEGEAQEKMKLRQQLKNMGLQKYDEAAVVEGMLSASFSFPPHYPIWTFRHSFVPPLHSSSACGSQRTAAPRMGPETPSPCYKCGSRCFEDDHCKWSDFLFLLLPY
jgi:hypothetical protein